MEVTAWPAGTSIFNKTHSFCLQNCWPNEFGPTAVIYPLVQGKSRYFLVAPVPGLAYGICLAAEPVELKTENNKINYSVGCWPGGDLSAGG
jgi:hypothetical protein